MFSECCGKLPPQCWWRVCPANGIAIPCITGNIGKGAAACMRSTVEAVKYRNQHASCHGLTGRELCFADTGEQTSLCDIGNSRCIPLICRYITEVCRTCGRLLHSCKNNFYHVGGFQMQQLAVRGPEKRRSPVRHVLHNRHEAGWIRCRHCSR